MSAFLDYLFAAGVAALSQLAALFGWTVLLAVGLHFTSGWIRGAGGGRFGMLYYWFVAPGVVCHETGHALGCLLTGTKIVEFVPFRPKGTTLGYVTHERHGGVFGPIAELIVATGPLWLGCAVVAVVVHVCAAFGFPSPGTARAPSPCSLAYAKTLFTLSADEFCRCCSVWKWSSPWFALAFYVIFCVASEMSLSASDLKGTWQGALVVFAVAFLVNLVPGADALISPLVAKLLPPLFALHVTMGFAFVVSLAIFLAVGVPLAFVGRR